MGTEVEGPAGRRRARVTVAGYPLTVGGWLLGSLAAHEPWRLVGIGVFLSGLTMMSLLARPPRRAP